MTFKRIYCIPTNRSITQAMESYVKEVDFAYKYFKEDFPFIIIETKNGVVEEENKNIISKISQKYPQINIIHLTMEKQEKLYTDLFKDNLLYLKRHYLRENQFHLLWSFLITECLVLRMWYICYGKRQRISYRKHFL